MTSETVTIIALLSALATALIGGVVWLGGDKKYAAYRTRFVWLSIFVCLWIGSNVLYSTVGVEAKFMYALLSYGLAMGLVVSLLLFCLQFLRHDISRQRLVLFSLPGIAAASLALIPGVIATGINESSVITNRFSLTIYGIVLLLYIFAACFSLIKGRIHAEKITMRRINIILTGLILSGWLGLLFNLYLPFLGVYNYTQLGPASSVIFISMVAYAIVRHGLFSIRFAAVRTLAYSLVLGTLVFIYFGLVGLISLMMDDSDQYFIYAIPSALMTLVLVCISHPVKRFFDRLTNKVFFQNSYESDEFLARLTRTLTVTTDLRSLMERASREICSTLNSEQGFFFINHRTNHHISAGTSRHTRLPVVDARALDKYVELHGDDVIVVDMLPTSDPIRRLMISHKIALILPLVHARQCLGYMCLGGRKSSTYTARDIRILETVSDELVIAIQNALSVQEVKELNATLQQRIDEATKELRHSNAQLQRLDEAKDEFVSMASHQLRTPLTSVKGYIDMVMEGDAGEITDMQRHFLGEAFTSSERMVHLINDFLNVSRLQTGKFMIERRLTDVVALVAQEVDSLRTSASQRKLTLSYTHSSNVPELYVDEGKIRQVVMNFIDNAMYYSREDSRIKIALTCDDDELRLSVQDSGIGVPESEQSQLFAKFFRATNARKQRPDGTGVGLFLAKKVITAHGGKVTFESTEGQGSTFGFTLPIEKMKLAPASDANNL